jgi:SAM-dependent methyltransferase
VSDERTLRFYADEAPAYAAKEWGEHSHLAAFLDRLEPGAHILELGCGGGRDASVMLAQGFKVDATDGVPEMARQAEARIGRPARVMRFDELDAMECYDAVWANASLLHVPRAELPGILRLIWRALKPGGLHFANFKDGQQEGRDRFGRYYNYLVPEELLDLYRRAADWQVVGTEQGVGAGYDGTPARWIEVTVQKC